MSLNRVYFVTDNNQTDDSVQNLNGSITFANNGAQLRWLPELVNFVVFQGSAAGAYSPFASQLQNNTNMSLVLDCPVPPPPVIATSWPVSGGVTVNANGIIPSIFQDEIPQCKLGSDDRVDRLGCAMSNLQLVTNLIGPLRWKNLVALSYYFEGDVIVGNSISTGGVLNNVGACTENRGTATNPLWENGQVRNCQALQDDFSYAVVEYLFNMCTGAGTRLPYTHNCDETGFRNYLQWSQGIYQWDIMVEHQIESQNVNSEFYGMSLSEYLLAIVSKYEDLAETTLASFTGYGVCPCSWVNDSSPQRGQPNGSTADPNDYLASYSYVAYPTAYGSHFKVY
jgi:hypothetical protein